MADFLRHKYLLDVDGMVLSDRDLAKTYESITRDDDRSPAIAYQGKMLSRGLSYAFAVEEYTIE